MDAFASRDPLVRSFSGVHLEVCYEELAQALHKGLILRRTLGMPLHADVTGKGLGVQVPDAFDEAVGRFGPRFECRGESVNALVVV